MDDRQQSLLDAKLKRLLGQLTSDARWDLEDERLFQIAGFTLTGYAVGVGRFTAGGMPYDQIAERTVHHLVSLGAAERYCRGLVDSAIEAFSAERDPPDVYTQLTRIGHSHWGSDDLAEVVDSVFANAEMLR